MQTIITELKSEHVEKIIKGSYLPDETKLQLKALKEQDYYFIFKNEYVHHDRNPMIIIELMESCQNNKIAPALYDVFIGSKYSMSEIIKKHNYKTWETMGIFTNVEVSNSFALQAFFARAKRKSLAKL